MSCEHQQMQEGSRTLCTAGLRPTQNSHSMAEPRGCKNHPWETVMSRVDEIFAQAGLPPRNAKKSIDYYNIDNIVEHTNNIQEQYCANTMSLGKFNSETSSQISSVSLKGKEPLDSGSGVEEAPFGPHNIKRALWQVFKNTSGQYKLKCRLNMTDGDNVEFIAPLQKTPKKSNFVKHAPDPVQASEFWQLIRREVKTRYSILPLVGKFHEKVGSRKNHKQSFTVEPECFGAAWFDNDLKCYRFTAMIYELQIEDEIIDNEYCTDKQKQKGVVGQHLWINPAHDTRKRPITAAERRRAKKPANYE